MLDLKDRFHVEIAWWYHISLDLYGVPSLPKIKVNHNIQLGSLTINLANINNIFHSSTLSLQTK